MRKNNVCLIIVVFVMALNLCANSLLFAQSVVLIETEVKEDDNAVKIMFSTNRSVSVECYDLSVPPQIIVDYMGEIYTNKPEVMMVNKGVVKQMRVIRGTKKSQDLDDSFYSVDFIIVDLKESMRYDFAQGLATSVLVISKPGKVTEAKKAQKEVAKLAAKLIPVAMNEISVEAAAPQASVKENGRISMEDKEYEMPVTVASKKAENVERVRKKRRRVAKEKKGRVKKSKRQKTMAEKSAAKETTFFGKTKKGIKNFFTFGKGKKKESSADKKIVKAKASKRAAEKEVKTKKKSKRGMLRRKRNKPREDKATEKIEKPKRKRRVRKGKQDKKATKPARATSEDGAYKNAIAQAESTVEQKTAELAVTEKNLAFNAESLKKADSAKKTIGQRIEDNSAKQEQLKTAHSESLKMATWAKNAANARWLEYSDAKEKLSLFLKNRAETKDIDEAQEIYEQKKTGMSQAINAAERAKVESEAKLAAYNMTVQEGDALLEEAEYHQKNVGTEQMQYNKAQEIVYTKKQELVNAQNELKKAKIEYKQYEIDKADAKFKESLFNIDQTLALETQKEQERKEQERLKRLEDERAEKMSMQKEMEDKEKAQLAALRQIEKNKDADKNKFVKERKEEIIRPKRRRVKTLVAPEAVSARTEVLSSAVELRNAGLEMQRKGDFDSAVKYYNQALISDPKYATVHNDLGILYEQKGFNEKAKMEYLLALKINPQYIKAHSNLALLYEKSGDNNKAYYHWKQRVQLGQPDDHWTQKAKERMELLEQQRK